MSKTLKELFDAHGSVWLAKEETPNKKYFKPLGYAEDNDFIIGEAKTNCRPITVAYYGVGLDRLVLCVEKEEIYEYAFLENVMRDMHMYRWKGIYLETEKEHEEFMKANPNAKVVKLRGPL